MKFIIIVCSLISLSLAATNEPEDYGAFLTGNKIFSGRIYKELTNVERGNFLVSPLSVQIALAVIQAGAKGVTEDEIYQKLTHLSSSSKTIYAAITGEQLLHDTQHYNLTSANKLYIKDDFDINESYKQDVFKNYHSAIERIDFSQSTKAAAEINKWVEARTRNKIRDLINPLSLDSYTKLVLVNALYFQGRWSVPFDAYATTKKDFYKSKNNIVKADTMQVLDLFNYYESPELNAKFLELPYKSDNKEISMIIVLPNEIDGLEQLEKSIDQIYEVPKFTPERVSVAIPKFSIETTIKFIDVLKRLGVKTLFSKDADLSGISGPPGSLSVSEVLQKNFINVTEDGTEAASATAVHGIRKSGSDYIPNDKIFVADHPFAFYITVKRLVIFEGRYSSS